jgi:two-component system, NarL family, sensor kinase
MIKRFLVANLTAVVLLIAGSIWASGTAAREEAIADARHKTDLLATLLVEPTIDEGLLLSEPQSVAAMDAALRGRLDSAGILRVKIWTPEGRIVYSDEPRLVGRNYPLSDDDLRALRDGVTRAELSDLTRPENAFESSAGRLLEVYREIRTPNGQPLLLETYSAYDDATARRLDIWRRFAPIPVAVLLGLLAMQLPLSHRLLTQLRSAGRERELLLARAADASTEERRRIAGKLHDGIVQDVSASALLVARAADQLHERTVPGPTQDTAEDLAGAAGALRHSAGSLRSLLAEIYPPALDRAGLASALADLGMDLEARDIEVRVDIPDELDLPLDTATLLYRVAQEALRNVTKHAVAHNVEVTLQVTSAFVVLEVEDDGVGFDLASAVGRPQSGHLGLSLLADLAAAGDSALEVRTASGSGTSVRLKVPRQ